MEVTAQQGWVKSFGGGQPLSARRRLDFQKVLGQYAFDHIRAHRFLANLAYSFLLMDFFRKQMPERQKRNRLSPWTAGPHAL